MWKPASLLAAMLPPLAVMGWLTATIAEAPKVPETKPKQTVERPFGGPPNRKPRSMGKRCSAPPLECDLEVPQQVGGDCSCEDRSGKVAK